MITKKLNRKQTRWVEFLFEFDFKIMYRSKKQKEKFDALNKRKQNLSFEINDFRKKHQRQTMLKDDQLNKNVKKTLTLCVFREHRRTKKNSFSKRTLLNKKNVSNSTTSLNQKIELSSRKIDDFESNAIIKNIINENENTKAKELLMTTFKNAFENDDGFIKLKQKKLNEDRKFSHKALKKKFKLFMKNLIIKNNLLYLKNKLIVLTFDLLRFRLLKRFHDLFIEEHFKYKAMFHAMFSSYFWSQMKDDCRRYAVNCVICRKSKAYNTQKQELLTSLSISQRKWLNLSLNFVKFLFKCTRKKRTYKHVLIIVNRLIKQKLYELMMSLFLDKLMHVMQKRIFCIYEFSASVISNRDTQFIVELSKRICFK